jgi:2-methylisocitrate lyase-like PEP mutase family enzyme
MSGSEIYERFLALHTREGGFVMPNAWDELSALLLADAGFEALGTSSAAFAASLGRMDGRHAVSRDEHLDHAQLLGRASGLPAVAARAGLDRWRDAARRATASARRGHVRVVHHHLLAADLR